MVSWVKKRDGRIVRFDKKKIENAILKAILSVKGKDGSMSGFLAALVTGQLNKGYKNRTPTVESIQDTVEKILIAENLADVAKSYIIYRERKAEERMIAGPSDIKLTPNAIKILEKRYLLKDSEGRVKETPRQMFRRVARAVASVEKERRQRRLLEKQFYEVMSSLEFLPNTPTLMNAGTKLGQLAACFVLPVEDSLKSIFYAVTNTAMIHQTAGGTGFSFSRLRPKGDMVGSTKGIASGPVSFMRVFDITTDVIKLGGKRRGANMGILNVDHPDIIEFITAKSNENSLRNFNISVGITDRFMSAVARNRSYTLINPRTRRVTRLLNARAVFGLITTMAWKTGDPGLIFLDEINRKNPLIKMGRIEATNPCGEVPLYSWESCNLGSINLAKLVKDRKLEWGRLGELVHTGVHFLDNVIDTNRYSLKEIKNVSLGNRRIGLGVMGFAEMLIQLGIPYDSWKAVSMAEKIMSFISREARRKSLELGTKKGVYPNHSYSKIRKMYRNVALTTIAPTGTISIIAGCSAGIEPLFAISFVREVMGGTRLIETNRHFEIVANERGFYTKQLMTRITRTGSVQDIKEVPADIKRIFKTAFDIKPEWHVRMQAAFQGYTDNSVSKTINFPPDASVEDVRKAYMLAYKLKCKGITIYRYGSKRKQVLYIGDVVKAKSEYAGGCPTIYCPH